MKVKGSVRVGTATSRYEETVQVLAVLDDARDCKNCAWAHGHGPDGNVYGLTRGPHCAS